MIDDLKKIAKFVLIAFVVLLVLGVIIGTISYLTSPPSFASSDDSVEIDIGQDGYLKASIKKSLQYKSENIPNGEVNVSGDLIKWKDEDIPFDVNLFLKTAIQKKIYPIYSREQKATWQNRVENEEIYLPTDSNGEIDVEFMQTIVHAEKKMAVRKVIAYKNDIVKEVTANRAQAIKPHCTTIPLHPSLTYNPVEFEPMMAAEDIFIYKI